MPTPGSLPFHGGHMDERGQLVDAGPTAWTVMARRKWSGGTRFDGRRDDLQSRWRTPAPQLRSRFRYRDTRPSTPSWLATHRVTTAGTCCGTASATSTPDRSPAIVEGRTPSWRSYHLLRGPLAAYQQFPDRPSYFWPGDRAWCLATDTDFEWAYPARQSHVWTRSSPVRFIDAYPTQPTNPARMGMDVINDPNHEIVRN